MKISIFEIIGTYPILMHNPAGMQRGGEGGMTTKKIPTAEVEAEAGVYKTEDGFMWFPSQAFKSSLVSASKGRRIGKQAATQVLKGTVFCAEERVHLLKVKRTGETSKITDTPKPATDYTIDTRRAVVQRNGILRSRPKVSDWATKVALEIDDMVSDKLVEDILNMAGQSVSGAAGS
jgi:hypothetical protein